MKKLKRKIKTERQRGEKNIVDLSIILTILQKHKFMSEVDFESLSFASAPFTEILSQLLAKVKKNKKCKLPIELGSFALNLHYYFLRAYNYVHKTFM